MHTTANAVFNGPKMDDERLGKLTRRADELKRRVNDGTLEYEWVMGELQQVIEGSRSGVVPEPEMGAISITIDTDLDPFVQERAYFLHREGTEHRKMGIITFERRLDRKLYANGKEVVRIPVSDDEVVAGRAGRNLCKKLKGVRVMNACVLDLLYAHQYLIPEEWKIDATWCWGTIFRSFSGNGYVQIVGVLQPRPEVDDNYWMLEYRCISGGAINCLVAAIAD